jgi:hypothetical protein
MIIRLRHKLVDLARNKYVSKVYSTMREDDLTTCVRALIRFSWYFAPES